MEQQDHKKVLTMAEIVAKSPDPVAAIKSLGASLAKSQMMGPTDRVEIGETLIMLCLTEGWTIGELFRTYQISFGKLEKKIDAAVAEFYRRGGKIEWLEDGFNGKTARARFSLNGESVEAGCTTDEAQKAGWFKNIKWINEPATMLRARTRKRGLVLIAPDIFFGEYEDQGGTEQVTLPPAKAAFVASSAAEQARAHSPAAKAAETDQASPVAQPSQQSTKVVNSPAAQQPKATEAPELPNDIQEQVLAIVTTELIPLATAWAGKVGWLKDGQSLSQLELKNAKSIIAKPDNFKAALNKFSAEIGGAT